MALAVTHKLAAGDTTNASSYTTASISVTAGDLIIVCCSQSATTPAAASVSGLGLTWTKIDEIVGGAFTLSYFWAITPTTQSGTLGIAFTGSATPTGAAWHIFTITGYNPVSPVNTNNKKSVTFGAGTTQTVTMTTAPASSSTIIAAWRHTANEGITAGTGFTVVGATFGGYATPVNGIAAESGANGTSVAASWVTSSASMALAIEVLAYAAPMRTLVNDQAVNRAAVI